MSPMPTPAPAAAESSPRRGPLGGGLFAGSCLFKTLFMAVVVAGLYLLFGTSYALPAPLNERYYSGKTQARDKVAVIRVEGVILEGAIGFAQEQIDRAAEDDRVKAVVLRINSPGGGISASDHLHHRLTLLRDGSPEKNTAGKPIVVSMGGIAASGGYYVAMPARTVFAERTTVTGSIGVYASFPNVKELTDKLGVRMYFIKRGDVKASGSPFREMTPEDQELWQEMVDHAYAQFRAVVEEGRPQLKGKLDEVVIDESRKVAKEAPRKDGEKAAERSEDGVFRYVRRRADGGIFTADRAKQFGLIDKIGYLEDAVKEAAAQAGLGEDHKVITYEKRFSLADALMGAGGPRLALRLDSSHLAEGATPRLWFMVPQAELAGRLTAAAR
jgi:protease IV